MNRYTPIVRAILADGRPHGYSELYDAIAAAVDPSDAVRLFSCSSKKKDRPSRDGLPLAEKVLIGKRLTVQRTLQKMLRRGDVVIVGEEDGLSVYQLATLDFGRWAVPRTGTRARRLLHAAAALLHEQLAEAIASGRFDDWADGPPSEVEMTLLVRRLKDEGKKR